MWGGSAVTRRGSPFVLARRPETRAAHARLVRDAAEAIAADPAGLDFAELAAGLGYSRWHLSRTFSRLAGRTLSQYRNQVRTARALTRLAADEESLAALAAECGFADQSHMARVVKAVTGRTVVELRRKCASHHGMTDGSRLPEPTPQ
jgi:AraC-like DNA-binding protein